MLTRSILFLILLIHYTLLPSRETFRVQEFHLPVYHALCLMLEDHFFEPHA